MEEGGGCGEEREGAVEGGEEEVGEEAGDGCGAASGEGGVEVVRGGEWLLWPPLTSVSGAAEVGCRFPLPWSFNAFVRVIGGA